MPLDTHMHADAATSADPDLAIDAKGLTKVYRGQGKAQDKLALDQVDLQIPRGSLFGLLGPNGAGKSTFINILAGLVTKTSGIARIWGYDVTDNPRMAKASIGVVPQELNIDPFFTPEEMLDVQAAVRHFLHAGAEVRGAARADRIEGRAGRIHVGHLPVEGVLGAGNGRSGQQAAGGGPGGDGGFQDISAFHDVLTFPCLGGF